jgi:hypothetical protein
VLGAIGIGALIGGLTSRARGGNFLKGALSGAALGGIGGMIGSKMGGTGFFGAGKGGIFGFGGGIKGLAYPAAAIGLGSEMLGQADANKQRMMQQRRFLEEEEERRIARLSKIAGYNVADPKNFLTPQSYFGVAEGGMISRPKYYNGGSATLDYTDPDLYSPTGERRGPGSDPIMEIPALPEPSFADEFENLELAGLTDDEMAELQSLQSLRIVTPEDDPNYEKIQIRLQELMGRLKSARGGSIKRPEYDRGGNIHPGTEDEGFTYDIDIDGDKYDFSFNEKLTEEGLDSLRKSRDIKKMIKGMLDDGELMMNEGGRVHAKAGLWANIHAKRARIKAGSGEKMRPAGSAGAPTDKALRESQATGGITDLDMRGGGESMGPGTGTSDDVPAMLSDGEFVMTAKAVENLGGGDRYAGARKMYSMMNSLDPNSQTPGEMNYVGRG